MKRAKKPFRVKPNEASEMLSIGVQTLRQHMKEGIFTVIAPKGRGVGKPTFLLTEEVEIYARGGPDALREHRAKKPAP